MENREDLSEKITKIELKILELEKRNLKVDLNKSWETSYTRLISIGVITYVTMILIFKSLGSANYLLDAIVPTLGFLLSTLSVGFIRNVWDKLVKKV